MSSSPSRAETKTVLDTLPCSLPAQRIPDDVDPVSVCQAFGEKIATLHEEDLVHDAVWRDMLALSSTLRTFYHASAIVATWRLLSHERQTQAFELKPETAAVHRAGPQVSWVQVSFTFNMALPWAASCLGYLCLVLDRNHKWKIWVVGTILDQLPELGDVDCLNPVQLAKDRSRSSMSSNKAASSPIRSKPSQSNKQNDYGCVVIGSGQSGLCTAGRLQALGVPYICVESSDQVGDCWRLRYDSVKLHTVRECSHLPFERTFTPDYPEWLTKDDLADAFTGWSERYGVMSHIWLSTTLESGSWDERNGKWTLHLRKRYPKAGDQSKLITVTSSHVVLGIGVNSHAPLYPVYANKSDFQGISIHSKDYKNSNAWRGKHGIVVGTANTGHDIAEDMLDAGLASVTMLQRTKTYVIPQQHYQQFAQTQYNAETDTKVGDIKCFAFPNAISRKLGLLSNHLDPEFVSGLEKAGFLLEQHDDITRHLCERFGGHYMDIGASKKIADGLIKIKASSSPISYTKTGLQFDDGSHLKADVIVFATGFGSNMRDQVQEFFGDKIASRAGDCWGLDNEGEIKGAFKPTRQPGLWYMAGSFSHSRFYSRFVAMHIKASLEGKALPVCDARQAGISPKV